MVISIYITFPDRNTRDSEFLRDDESDDTVPAAYLATLLVAMAAFAWVFLREMSKIVGVQ